MDASSATQDAMCTVNSWRIIRCSRWCMTLLACIGRFLLLWSKLTTWQHVSFLAFSCCSSAECAALGRTDCGGTDCGFKGQVPRQHEQTFRLLQLLLYHNKPSTDCDRQRLAYTLIPRRDLNVNFSCMHRLWQSLQWKQKTGMRLSVWSHSILS